MPPSFGAPFVLPLLIFSTTFPRQCAGLNLTQLGTAAYAIKLGALWNLEQMSWCRLGLSAGMAFNGYGCWCGRGGSGDSVDGIDACCKQHDLCYDWVVYGQGGECKSTLGEYVSQYEWNCIRVMGLLPAVMCAEERNKGCGRQICRCDQQLVNCWASLPKPQCKKQCKTRACPGDANNSTMPPTNSSSFGIFGTFSGVVDNILRQIGKKPAENASSSDGGDGIVEVLAGIDDQTGMGMAGNMI